MNLYAQAISDNPLETHARFVAAAAVNSVVHGEMQDFQALAYSQIRITGDPETVRTDDEAALALRQMLERSHAYMGERYSQIQYDDDDGFKETVLGSRMSGFDSPVTNTFTIDFASYDLYGKFIYLFDAPYPGLATDHAADYYNITQSTTTGGDLLLSFIPRRSTKVAGLTATLTLDPRSYAITYAQITVVGGLLIEYVQDYERTGAYYVPSASNLSITQGDGTTPVSIFNSKIPIGNLEEPDGAMRSQSIKKITRVLSLQREVRYSDMRVNTGMTVTRPETNVQIDSNAGNRDEAWWQGKRALEFTERDAHTFETLNDPERSRKFLNRINTATKFSFGFFPIGPIDLDLKYLFKYNNFEAVRTGLGGQTNERFSDKLTLNWYSVYGFKDHRWKYQFGARYKIDGPSGTYIGASLTSDLQEIGSLIFLTDARAFSLFEPRLVNIPNFYDKRVEQINFSHRVEPELQVEAALSRKRIQQTTPYSYVADDGEIFDDYRLTEATVGIRWTPGTDYLYGQEGFRVIRSGFPSMSAQYTRGVSGFLNSDFGYDKLSGKITYRIDRLDQSSTEFFLEGHYARGSLPITELFHAYPNAPVKDALLQRFSVAGRRSFETMYFNEFFSDRLAVGQVKHYLRPFQFTSSYAPQLVLVTRYALGSVRDEERHLGIPVQSLRQGYGEAGFEMNNLIYAFGISFMTRYGAYTLPDFEDNLSLKFTFYLEM